MKKVNITSLFVLCVFISSCSIGFNSGQDSYANLPREWSPAIFEFSPLPSTAQETSESADLIVIGTVLSVSSTSTNAIISTSIEFIIEDVLKGDVEIGETVIIETNDGAMRKSDLRQGYTGVLENASNNVEKNRSALKSFEDNDDPLVIQLMPYGGLYTPGTREVLCLSHRDDSENNVFSVKHGAYCRQIEMAEGEFADLNDVIQSMENLGYSELEAPDPALIPDDLPEKVVTTRDLDELKVMYGLHE